MRVAVSVLTCMREDLLGALLDDLEREEPDEVRVYEDPTPADYSGHAARCAELGWGWVRFEERLGPTEVWRAVDRQYRDCREIDADLYVFLDDDARLVPGALEQIRREWAALVDPSALTLCRLATREGRSNWTGVEPYPFGGGTISGWFDCAYVLSRDALAALEFSVAPRRRRDTSWNQQSSEFLHALGRLLYRVDRSLAYFPYPDESLLTPELRLREPLVTL